MSIFEIQIVSGGRWKACDAFDDYDEAYECAERIERTRQPEQLRIRRIDHLKPGSTRERTMYDGGQKTRRDGAAERKRQDEDAFRQRVADRRVHRNKLKNAAGRINVLFSGHGPVYLTLVSLSIGLIGLSALYLVERVFTS